ncbi:MAG: N-acetylmuramoyl-L-alanine amidase [Actinobacteria bacterium]|nr:N-acetylmuramoyl-L-alanine amidase [Actinomycetota bacterium]MCW3044635.1 N-acetylmuramoyl-L-alanine amidase [Actinomycetota bacterium]MEA2567483.1 N-acetylmuramoyl-L-alanine amidase [Actinomycetota bacterium]
MRLIRRGERSNAVQDLQARLERLGIDIAPQELGGDFGPATEMAVRAFQQSRGLDVDGIVGDNTWRVLVESSWSLGDRILRLEEPNLRGDDVRDLQSRLNALGFAAGKHDGIYGRATAAALMDFQRNLGISDDGLIGLETLKAFRRLRLVTRTGLGPRTREREARRSGPPGVAGKRLVLDPGHGGDDPGGRGPSGETEADLVFPLATQLAGRLEAEGAEVTLTRGPHDGPTDSERARRANEAAADLLISLHLNAHPNEMAQGAATYYWEHGGIASEPGEHLADLLQDHLVRCGLVDCRSHGKAYPILRETRMPAVVVEPGFITNPDEAKMLSAPRTAEPIVLAMVRAVGTYFGVAGPAIS